LAPSTREKIEDKPYLGQSVLHHLEKGIGLLHTVNDHLPTEEPVAEHNKEEMRGIRVKITYGLIIHMRGINPWNVSSV